MTTKIVAFDSASIARLRAAHPAWRIIYIVPTTTSPGGYIAITKLCLAEQYRRLGLLAVVRADSEQEMHARLALQGSIAAGLDVVLHGVDPALDLRPPHLAAPCEFLSRDEDEDAA